MKIKVINDWKYLFEEYAIGGRFASFTFISCGWMTTKINTDDLEIGGFHIVLLGIGIRVWT